VTAVVRVRNLTKRYRDLDALHDVSFDLHEGAIHGLLGRNGAGKTTLMRVLTAQALTTSGTIEVFGEPPFENERVQQRICFVGESQRYPASFTVHRVLEAGRLLYPTWDAGYAAHLAADFRLPLRRPASKLSRGMLSAMGIVVGLAARTPFTLFDEPYLGLDAVARQMFYDRLLTDYAEHPRTVLLSTHLIDEVADLLERVLLIDNGRLLLDDDAEALRARAVTVAGPLPAVDEFVVGRHELHRERLATFARVTVPGPLDPAEHDLAGRLGLELAPVSLQQLVVRATGREDGAAATADTSEGVLR